MASFFHAYDLRGKYPDEISEKEAEKVGKAFGTFVDGEVLVGRDGRSHAKTVTQAFIEGIISTGTNVKYAGRVPSPVIYFGTVKYDMVASAVVTASHNPSEYTGFKFSKENALAMSREGGMKQIENIYESGNFDSGEGDLENLELKNDYIEFVSDKINFERDIKVAVNYGNGVTSIIGKELLEELGCQVTSVNKKIDGGFPNHLPAPGEEEAQKQLKEQMEGQDLGIIFDGDGDRAGFIIEGEYISEDEVLTLFSERSLGKRKGKVVHDLRASKLVPEKIRENGGEPVETRVGHTFISEKIHDDEDIVFAGELSGHYYFPVYGISWDDGLFAAALMGEIVSEIDVKQKLEEYPHYPVSPELRIDCPHEAKEHVIDEVVEEFSDHETSTVDGVKIYFEKGWALVRPSNTEEKMSVRCEADTEEDLDKILEEVEGKVRKFIDNY